MAISSSLYSSISGLSTMGEAMSVLGDNVANVNTVAFKSSRSTFQDVLSQSVSTAAGSAQVGRGVTLSAIDGLFAQGSFESSSTATDLAIGGQGFFMLRASDSTEADMYSRAGEFRFDQEGNLTTPIGHFAQGWGVSSTTGEREGTIGDINIGKSTPPVSTTLSEIIANLDSRKANEANEDRLYNSWNGTNAAQAVATDPISSSKYEYTTAIKTYDSKGASHDISVYFDRTSNDNEWEFLVACDPTEDKRLLTTSQQTIYNPATTFDYTVSSPVAHKGAGALMYGILKFDTSGNMTNIEAYNVPPDGVVNPAKAENRISLSAGDTYFSFETNFTGASTNDSIKLNLGATYEGTSTTKTQRLVSDAGAVTSSSSTSSGGTNYINTATLWSDVADSSGNGVSQGDTFIMEGYVKDGTAVNGTNRLVYTVDTTKDIQDFLTAIQSAFSGTQADIDAQGRLTISDSSGGSSALSITRFETMSANVALPFGGAHGTKTTSHVVSPLAMYTDNTAATFATNTAQTLIAIFDPSGSQFDPAGTDDLWFDGVAVDGTAIGAPIRFDVGATITVQQLLDTISDVYADGTKSGAVGAPGTASNLVTAVLSGDGKIRVIDNTDGTSLDVQISIDDGSGTPADPNVDPWGITSVAVAPSVSFGNFTSYDGQIDVSTANKTILSTGRASTSITAGFSNISTTTSLDSVYAYDGQAVPVWSALTAGQIITIAGLDRDGNTSSVAHTVAAGETVQTILDKLEAAFKATASINNSGRLVLTDFVADTSATTMNSLTISSITYSANTVPRIFGTGADYIDSDITSEDGSVFGGTITSDFEPEALTTTQYANSSTTVFQDQDGFSSGFLQSVSVDVDGIITGHYSNGQVLKKAQIALANFSNLAGLTKEGGNIYTETTDSGAPVTGTAGTNGLGSIAPNALEQSNVDLGAEFVKLITVQRGFQANSKIITTTDDMLNDLINIKR